jgi:hypothetical protein
VHLGDAHVADSDDGTNTKKIKPPEKQQWLVAQQEDGSFDYSKLPFDYICLPVRKCFPLFDNFKHVENATE